MTCEEVERDELVEHYVLGRLDERRQEAFEDHYFNCAACLERVRALQDAGAELAAQETGRAPRRWPRAAAAVVAAAALIVLAVRVGQEMPGGGADRPSNASPRADVVLPVPPPRTTIELPPYTPPRLRAVPGDAQRAFSDAMTAYTTRDCAGALAGLRRALSIDDSFIPARFYLGVCELHGSRITDAAANLQRVIAAGESPYLEDAHFFLAHARIQQGDTEGARQELGRVLALQGDRREEAKRLLDQLR